MNISKKKVDMTQAPGPSTPPPLYRLGAYLGVIGLLVILAGAFSLLAPLSSGVEAAATVKTGASNSGLVGWWKFDEGSGTTAQDSSGSGNKGTLTNSPTWTSGKLGKGLGLNGTNNTVTYGTNMSTFKFGTGSFTISAWVNPINKPSGFSPAVFGVTTSGTASRYALDIDYFSTPGVNRIIGFVRDDSNNSLTLSPAQTIPSNQWSHVVMVVDRSATNKVFLYLNGVALANGDISSFTDNISPKGSALTGGIVNGAADFLQGTVDDVRVYSRALSAAEAQSLYKAGTTQVNAPSTALTNGSSLQTGLVGFWTMDGKDTNWATGQETDKSGNGNVGSLAAIATSTGPTRGKIGQAISLNRNNSEYLDMGNVLNPGTGDMTVSAWFKTSTTYTGPAPGIIISKRDPAITSNAGFAIAVGSAQSITAAISDGSATRIQTISTPVVNDGKWHHVIVTFQRTGSMTTYVDGVAAGSGSAAISSQQGSVSNTVALQIGKQFSVSNPGYFFGQIDDVRIYTRALSAAEVKQLYNLGATKTDTSSATLTNGSSLASGLVGLWTFDGKDLTSTTAIDRSGNGNTGTLTNGPMPAIGKMGQAMSFNGTTQYINAGNGASLNFGPNQDFSVGFWMKTTSSPGSTKPLAKANVDSQATGWGFYQNSGSLFLKIGNGGGSSLYEQSVSTINDGTWHHVFFTITRSGNCVKYKDGAVVGTTGCSAWAAQDFTNATFPLIIGANNNSLGTGVNSQWQGSLDDVRVYSRVLSAAEIKQLYLLGK